MYSKISLKRKANAIDLSVSIERQPGAIAYSKIKIDGHVNFISRHIKMLSKSNTDTG